MKDRHSRATNRIGPGRVDERELADARVPRDADTHQRPRGTLVEKVLKHPLAAADGREARRGVIVQSHALRVEEGLLSVSVAGELALRLLHEHGGEVHSSVSEGRVRAL